MSDDEPLGDFRYGSEEFEDWRQRTERVWAAYEMGVRDSRILRDLLEPEDAARVRLVTRLFKGAASGFDAQVACMFGQVAIAGLAADVPDLPIDDAGEDVALGWMFVGIAADGGWEPAEAIIERYAPPG